MGYAMSKSTLSLSKVIARRWDFCIRAGLASLTLATAFLNPMDAAAQTATDTTYMFTGSCSDCTGTGVGYLTLQNYTPGTALSYSDFVSFTYTSNLSSFSITSQGMQYSVPNPDGGTETYSDPKAIVSVGMTGVLGATGPSDFNFLATSVDPAVPNFTNSVSFLSCLNSCPDGDSSGYWQLGASLTISDVANSEFPGGKSGQINDYGTAHSWSAVAAPEIDPTSAVAALTLLLGSLATLGGRRLPRSMATNTPA
jgi:hypothetical protein